MSEYQDKLMVCADCGDSFTWTADDQAYFAEKSYAKPHKRCKPCRHAKKQRYDYMGTVEGW